MVYIRKIQNIAKSETLAIDKTVLLIKAKIDKKKLDVSIRKVWGL